jgi:peptide chain release factor 1
VVQSKNKVLAIRIVEERVRQYEAEISAASARAGRQASWDGGNRSNKIRTYNFIESRAVDHRTGKKTTQVLDVIGKGRFDLLK